MNTAPPKTVKQVLAEPWEVLKEAGKQVTGMETPADRPQENKTQPVVDETSKRLEEDKQLSLRRIEALNRELADIVRDKLWRELQEKIAAGEEVYLEEYPQLSLEQKQVLQAQIEAIKVRQAQQALSQKPLTEPAPKRSRRLFGFGFGQKSQAERQKTRVERPLPPSG